MGAFRRPPGAIGPNNDDVVVSATVAIASDEVTVEVFGVSVGGVKVQVVCVGRSPLAAVGQLKVIAVEKLPSGSMAITYRAGLPAVTV